MHICFVLPGSTPAAEGEGGGQEPCWQLAVGSGNWDITEGWKWGFGKQGFCIGITWGCWEQDFLQKQLHHCFHPWHGSEVLLFWTTLGFYTIKQELAFDRVTEVETQVGPLSCVRSPDVGGLGCGGGVGIGRERSSSKYYLQLIISVICCLLSITTTTKL